MYGLPSKTTAKSVGPNLRAKGQPVMMPTTPSSAKSTTALLPRRYTDTFTGTKPPTPAPRRRPHNRRRQQPLPSVSRDRRGAGNTIPSLLSRVSSVQTKPIHRARTDRMIHITGQTMAPPEFLFPAAHPSILYTRSTHAYVAPRVDNLWRLTYGNAEFLTLPDESAQERRKWMLEARTTAFGGEVGGRLIESCGE